MFVIVYVWIVGVVGVGKHKGMDPEVEEKVGEGEIELFLNENWVSSNTTWQEINIIGLKHL